MNKILINIKNNPVPFLNSRQASQGFTLVEVIISLTVFSLVILLIGSGFRLGIKAWQKGEAETLETQKLRALSSLMYQQLKSAFPYEIEVDDEKVVVFKGERDSILFVTTFVDPDTGGFKWVKFSYKDKNLVYYEGIMPDKSFLDKTEKDEEIIDSDISEFEFNFFTSDEEGWTDSWEMNDKIPSAVKVKIAFFQPFLITIPMSQKDEDEDEDDEPRYNSFKQG